MYIAPDSKLNVLSNIRLDNTYQHSIYFESVSAQTSYFVSKLAFSLDNLSYLRVENKIRINVKADSLYNCNYIMFQNTAFGQKWFYAFITDLEYISNETTDITFEIDVIQTWLPSCTIQKSFVEREHILNDTFGANLVEENLDTGEYVAHEAPTKYDLGDMAIVVATADLPTAPTYGSLYGNIFAGITFVKFGTSFSELARLETFLADMTTAKKIDSIVSIYMIPDKFMTSGGNLVYPLYTDTVFITRPSTIGTYTPKNKKVLQFPYNFLYVSNLSGRSANYKYEYFTGLESQFQIAGTQTCNPEMSLTPLDYKVPAAGLVNKNPNERLTLSGFPQCAYVVDSFKAWLAQNAGSLAGNVLASTAAIAGGIATANGLAIMGGIVGAASSIGALYDKSQMPDQARGQQTSNVAFSTGDLSFMFIKQQVTEERAQIIDEFFELYGYKTNRLKVPNINTRPYWNYVKTIDANIIGNVPFGYMSKIKSCFNNGITFWKNGDNIGNYTLNNH